MKIPSPQVVEGCVLTAPLYLSHDHPRGPFFNNSVIFVFAHTAEGTLGLTLNKRLDEIVVPKDAKTKLSTLPQKTFSLYAGGPEENDRSFVLHEEKKSGKAQFCVTTALDFKPQKLLSNRSILFTLGYVAWQPGELDEELQSHCWLLMQPSREFLFRTKHYEKWTRSMHLMGIDLPYISSTGGYA